MARSALSSLLVLALLGCDEPPSAPAPRPPAPPAEAPVGASECELGAPEAWIEDAARGSLALSAIGRGGLVVLATADELVTRELGADGHARGAAHRAAVGRLDALLALEPRGERHVLIGRGACDESAHCLVAMTIEGSAIGAPVTAALPEPIRTFRRAASAGEDAPIFLAWSTTGGARALDRFVVEGGSLGRVRVPLGVEPASEEAPVEILGLAADGDRWAVIWRRGPTEDVRSHVYLTTADSHVDTHALHDALAIDAIELSGETVSLIATFEFSRPHHVRLRPGREEPEHARELPAGGALPPPFAERERAELEADERGLWLSRRDAAGDPIGSRSLVARGAIESAALARSGEVLLVAWQAGGVVRGRAVRCP